MAILKRIPPKGNSVSVVIVSLDRFHVECFSIRERTENYSKVGMKAAAVVTEKEAFNAEI